MKVVVQYRVGSQVHQCTVSGTTVEPERFMGGLDSARRENRFLSFTTPGGTVYVPAQNIEALEVKPE
jgi:hypothetical protein